jgi:hypothetical protein
MLSPDLIAFRRGTKISNEMRSDCYSDSLVLEPAFEISIIFGRSLLNFLGITYDNKAKELKRFQPKKDDLTIKDIYPEQDFCPLDDDLILENKDALGTIMKIANKSVAHLTSTLSNENEHAQLEKARLTIYGLILKYVPDINKTGIWWHQQVSR